MDLKSIQVGAVLVLVDLSYVARAYYLCPYEFVFIKERTGVHLKFHGKHGWYRALRKTGNVERQREKKIRGVKRLVFEPEPRLILEPVTPAHREIVDWHSNLVTLRRFAMDRSNAFDVLNHEEMAHFVDVLQKATDRNPHGFEGRRLSEADKPGDVT